MGHNVDLQWLMGLPEYVRCTQCKELTRSDFDEYDIDCGTPNASSGIMILDVQCAHCQHEISVKVEVSFEVGTVL